MNQYNIKQKVLSNKLLENVLNQIEDPIEREKTLNAINKMLDDFQGKTNVLIKTYQESQENKKTENK
jgi:hypothetical protein